MTWMTRMGADLCSPQRAQRRTEEARREGPRRVTTDPRDLKDEKDVKDRERVDLTCRLSFSSFTSFRWGKCIFVGECVPKYHLGTSIREQRWGRGGAGGWGSWGEGAGGCCRYVEKVEVCLGVQGGLGRFAGARLVGRWGSGAADCGRATADRPQGMPEGRGPCWADEGVAGGTVGLGAGERGGRRPHGCRGGGGCRMSPLHRGETDICGSEGLNLRVLAVDDDPHALEVFRDVLGRRPGGPGGNGERRGAVGGPLSPTPSHSGMPSLSFAPTDSPTPYLSTNPSLSPTLSVSTASSLSTNPSLSPAPPVVPTSDLSAAAWFLSPTPLFGVSGFEVTLCRQGPEAVEAVRAARAEGHPFAVAFVDVRMPPGPDGLWTSERIRELDPDVNIVVVTGFVDLDPGAIAARVPPVDKLLYIQKPFRLRELHRIAAALSAKWTSERNWRGRGDGWRSVCGMARRSWKSRTGSSRETSRRGTGRRRACGRASGGFGGRTGC
jgi:CheY-like chemotaxis protein